MLLSLRDTKALKALKIKTKKAILKIQIGAVVS